MSDKISLKVVIAGRTYPLYLHENEIDKVQQAADDINKSIKLLQENYAVKDMQDLLAMTALQLASKSGKQNEKDFSEIESKLQEIINNL